MTKVASLVPQPPWLISLLLTFGSPSRISEDVAVDLVVRVGAGVLEGFSVFVGLLVGLTFVGVRVAVGVRVGVKLGLGVMVGVAVAVWVGSLVVVGVGVSVAYRFA